MGEIYFDFENHVMITEQGIIPIESEDVCIALKDLLEHKGKCCDLWLTLWPDMDRNDKQSRESTEARRRKIIYDIRKLITRLTGIPGEKCVITVRGKGTIYNGPDIPIKQNMLQPPPIHNIVQNEDRFLQDDWESVKRDHDAREQLRQKNKEEVDEKFYILDVYCNKLCQADSLETIKAEKESYEENIGGFYNSLKKYLRRFSYSMQAAEELCEEYASYINERLYEEKGNIGWDDVTAQRKAEALEILECYFSLKIWDILLHYFEAKQRCSSLSDSEKEYCEILKAEDWYGKGYGRENEAYMALNEVFCSRITQEIEHGQDMGRTR